MDEEPPTLQTSNTDGTGSVKRRRPALSCVECRKRKVKCDRAKPCGPCTRTKSPTCTYRPITNEGRMISLVSTSVRQGESSQYSPHGKGNPIGHDLSLDQYFTTRTSANAFESDSTIQALAKKVDELEGKLASLGNESTSPERGDASHQHGQFVKFKFFGESHWVNAIEPYDALGRSFVTTNPQTDRVEVNKSTELYIALVECKNMARVIKNARLSHSSHSPDIQSTMPPRTVSDELVQGYLRTFEGAFRVLHIPSFVEEYESYWTNPSTVRQSVLIKILLVCAIGVPFYRSEGQASLRARCTRWVQAAETWLNGPHGKSRLNLTGVQIHILLILARQVCKVDGDLVGISAGALLRSSMHLGLHRDPSLFSKISVFHAEMRRRLWATVLELTVHTSLDMGMSPLISPSDYDTRPPSNINDEDIHESKTTITPKPPHEFTQTSIQLAFLQTLPLRLEMTRLLNNIHTPPSYDTTIRLSTDLLTQYRITMSHLQPSSATSTLHSPTPFILKLYSTLIQRFALCLHRPYFLRARTDPRYYYSRKFCLDVSLSILAPCPPDSSSSAGEAENENANEDEEEEDDWIRLGTHSVGFLKHLILYSIGTVYIELIQQLTDLFHDPLHHHLHNNNTTTTTATTPSLPITFPTLRSTIIRLKKYSYQRIRCGEPNSKAAIFFCCALARIDAMAARRDPDPRILEAARESIQECARLMREAYRDEWGVDIDVGVGERENADVDAVVDRGCGGDGDTAGVGWSSGQDMDWESLMRDEILDFGFGFDVDGSPESWFLGGYEGGAGVEMGL
ncbi:hypothetical protein B0J11DRAFT_166337 [Dendryphion nanum]|uniref:Zn(2)-C6 fungal-type domain-containing protein n=1 Tax=Dendryphion nanum TaxID=256645 RepID=A0A9P9EAH5_9PLEO|nr:hypothetical protein B0J11DRAFT_166337 [Dendryphion nanum]